MAIDRHVWRLLEREALGDLLTLGRQHDCTRATKLEERSFADETLIPALGDALRPGTTGMARSVASLDVSKAEGPTWQWDLNEPVPHDLRHRFDCVFDGGTLEHVFNVPIALENVRVMLRPGGVFCSHQLLNLAGHGFWGFTPELLWAWSLANGFTEQRCCVSRIGRGALWREIAYDGQRIEFTSVVPLQMFFRARKVEEKTGVPTQAAPPRNVSTLKFFTRHARLWRWPKAADL